jgi:hypothetical protein
LQAIALHLGWKKEEPRERKRGSGLQLLVWIGCSSKFRVKKKRTEGGNEIVFRFLSKNFRRKESCMHEALNEVYL